MNGEFRPQFLLIILGGSCLLIAAILLAMQQEPTPLPQAQLTPAAPTPSPTAVEPTLGDPLLATVTPTVQVQRAVQLLAAGLKAMENKDYPLVVSAMTELLTIEPTHREAHNLLSQAQQLLPKPTEIPLPTPTQAPEQEQIVQTLAQLQVALDQKNLGESKELLDSLESLIPEDERLVKLRSTYRDLESKQKKAANEDQAKQQELDRLLTLAHKAFDDENLKDCFTSLNQALELAPAYKPALDLLRQVQDYQRAKNQLDLNVKRLTELFDTAQYQAVATEADNLLQQHPEESRILKLRSDALAQIQQQRKQPPVINDVLVGKPVSGKPLALTAAVSDNGTIVKVTLFYRESKADNFTPLIMTQKADGYSALIPKEIVSKSGLDYYITAEDNDGNQVKFPSGRDFNSITVQEKSAPRIKGF